MMNQFIEGLPGVVETEDKTYFDIAKAGFEDEQLAFYEEYLAATETPASLLSSRFVVSEARARGIYELRKIAGQHPQIMAIKGQITGPFTLLTGLADQDHRLGYYNETFREMAVKALAMKGAWQVRFLKNLQLPVIIFIDEPALAGLGSSAFISIAKDDIAQDLTEVIDAIKQAGGLAGIHVCANTDWNFLLALDLDILSFDAHGFFDRLITCKEQIHDFLARGGVLAWGIVPTADVASIMSESSESLVALWERQTDLLLGGRWDKAAIVAQSLITPSCGTGALPLEAAQKVLALTRDVSSAIRKRHLGVD
jgi:methionine synthase II (cobalamin-independent)